MEELEKNETSTQAEENTVSLASAQALADALAKIEAYTPTTWVDNSSPDIDAEHLNKPEQAIKRVTDALNSAVDAIKDLQSQVTKNAGAISDVNNNLSNFTVMRNASGVNQFKAVDQNGNNGMLFKVKDNSEFSVNVWKDNAFGNEKILATKDDLNTVLMYRGVITGDLNRGRNLAIAPGIYSIQSVSTVTNGPSDFIGWGIFVQFPDNLFSQMILNSPNYIKFRKYSGSNQSWSAW